VIKVLYINALSAMQGSRYCSIGATMKLQDGGTNTRATTPSGCAISEQKIVVMENPGSRNEYSGVQRRLPRNRRDEDTCEKEVVKPCQCIELSQFNAVIDIPGVVRRDAGRQDASQG
jgi:hypothetical protein